jgi:hypothetical protein
MSINKIWRVNNDEEFTSFFDAAEAMSRDLTKDDFDEFLNKTYYIPEIEGISYHADEIFKAIHPEEYDGAFSGWKDADAKYAIEEELENMEINDTRTTYGIYIECLAEQ